MRRQRAPDAGGTDGVPAEPAEAAALSLIASLPGVRAARLLGAEVRAALLDAEERYERDAAIPLENAGVRAALRRETVVAILKDASFRKPPAATLYLVEEAEGPRGEEIDVEGRVYHVIGEEVVADGQGPAEGGVPLSDRFFLYPERRTRASAPSRFLLPPVRFPELDGRDDLRDVVSASPSPLGDACVRRACGYAEDPSLATLLVGFDRSRGRPGGRPRRAADSSTAT